MYLYELHDRFEAVPTFFLTLTFWATSTSKLHGTNGIPPFPPPIMAREKVIPQRFLRNDSSLKEFPVIHTWQSIVWHERGVIVPAPPSQGNNAKGYYNQIRLEVDLTTIAVQPKSIGTFVTTQTQIKSPHERHLKCTMQSTALVMGISPEDVLPYKAGVPRLSSLKHSSFFASKDAKKTTPMFQWSFQTKHSQALLYRIASGDSNHIHVDTSVSQQMGSEQRDPILHGLFTLSLAFRAIVKLLHSNILGSNGCNVDASCTDGRDIHFRCLEGKFTQPAFVGDCLCIKIWNSNDDALFIDTNHPVSVSFEFVIANKATGTVVVDCGLAEVDVSPPIKANMARL